MKFELLVTFFFNFQFCLKLPDEEIFRLVIPPQPNFMNQKSPELRLTLIIGYALLVKLPSLGGIY